MRGLGPRIPIPGVLCLRGRDGRDKPGHDGRNGAHDGCKPGHDGCKPGHDAL
jgi:hypothetical protein